jgi:Fe-S-cluster containining protein
MRCGACCAIYRVTFDCHETDTFPGGLIPSHLVFKLNQTRSAMRGTEKRPIRCQALSGEIGRAVLCTIYDRYRVQVPNRP